MAELDDIKATALDAIAIAPDASALDEVRVRYLGKKGELTGLLKGLGQLPADERPAAGAAINQAKSALQDAIALRKDDLESAAIDSQLASETIDVTLPGRRADVGALHPTTRYCVAWRRFLSVSAMKWWKDRRSRMTIITLRH